MSYQRIEVLTGTERRRMYTPEEKLRLVEEVFRPGVVVAQAARRLGVHESLLHRWRRQLTAECKPAAGAGFAAVAITPEPIPPSRSPAASAPVAGPAAVLEIELANGTRARLSGPVDPALAAAALGALVASGRVP